MLKKDLFSIQFIDIVSVESSTPISNYSVDEIEKLATNYLECGGNINPIIVERIGLDEYRVVHGNLELYAAQRAREKDKFFEMIRAIILDKKNETFVDEQINLLDKKTPLPITDIDHKLIRLENSILAKIDSLNQKINNSSTLNIVQNLEGLESTLLDRFNQLTIKLDTLQQTTSIPQLRKTDKTDIRKMNVSELKAEAKKRGFSGYTKLKKAELVALLSQDNP